MPRCPSCATENPPASRYCGTCASPLTPASLTPTIAVAAAPSRTTSAVDEGRFPPGTLLAERYRVVSQLGRGGMGEVYRATDLRLGQTVALKFLPEATARDTRALARFHNEVRIARQISHPNVCRVYDIGEIDGLPFLSMEYIDGEDLGSLLRRIGRLPTDKALEMARQLCAGLAAAHDKGVLHRDLKPANIMVDGRGQLLITDFGLAAVAGAIEVGEIRSGTPAYMSPEQLAGKDVSVRSDLYALGLVLYEIFAGKHPFQAGSLPELLRMQEESVPASLTTLIRDLDPAVERAILRCLAPDPRHRPPSALAVAAALPGGDPLAAALAAGETPSPELVAASGETEGLKPATAALLLAAVLATLLAVAGLSSYLDLFTRTPFDRTPDALAGAAQDFARKLGYPQRPAASAWNYTEDNDYFDYAGRQWPKATRWRHLSSGQPAPVRLWYRQSPRLLNPGNDLFVSFTNPPFNVAGMLRIRVDLLGRLISFEAVPPQFEPNAAPAAPPDWSPLFAAAGLDIARFTPAAPQWTPETACDARAAWTGVWPDASDVPIRVEAAAWQGKPVSFQIVQPWTKPARMEDPRLTPGQKIGRSLLVLLLAGMIATACLLAWQNLKLNRGDRRGAARLAGLGFVLTMLQMLFMMSHVASQAEGELLAEAAANALFTGAVLGILYLALEPYIRKSWPQTMVSWTRMLSGRLRDPVVGRDILLGVLFGLVWILMVQVIVLFVQRTGEAPDTWDLGGLVSTRHVFALLFARVTGGLAVGFGIFLMVFLLRLLVRKNWLAGTLFVILVALVRGFGSGMPGVMVPMFAVIFTFAVILLLRFGLVPLAVGCSVLDFSINQPLTLDTSAWYFPTSLLVMALIAAVALYGFHTALAGRPLLKSWEEAG